jgi:hypothetical protein
MRSASGITAAPASSPHPAWVVLAILVYLGLLSFAAVRSDTEGVCRPFTLGVSAFGGCDPIGSAVPLP